jgi:TIR domain
VESPGIFLSYRREETAGYARVIYDRLTTRFSGQIFMDVTSINPGVDFGAAIDRAVSESRVLIALIGKHWDTVTTETGNRRLDDPKDFVRLEIATALNRGLLVVPTLLPGATLPRSDHLPEPLVGLTRRQAIQITDANFDTDIQRLISVIEQELGPPKIHQLRRLRLSTAFAAAIIIVLGVAVAGYFLHWFTTTVRPAGTPPTIAPGITKRAGQVTAHGMLANDGWMISFGLPDEHIREIFYKFGVVPSFETNG